MCLLDFKTCNGTSLVINLENVIGWQTVTWKQMLGNRHWDGDLQVDGLL